MAEDDRTRGWSRPAAEVDAMVMLRAVVARVHAVPHDADTQRRLRAIASIPTMWELVLPILVEEAQAALVEEPAAAAVFLEELARTFESLDRPLEEIAALEQLVALVPEHVDHLDRLARRYAHAGAWAKAAETFQRIGALAPKEQACTALRAAAGLYRDNAQAERALEAYRAILEIRPADKDAWRELDAVLEQLERWRELADVRGELANRAPSAVDKASRLRAQARALEQAGDSAAAADAMAEAARHAPDDVSGLLDYADVLARTGRAHEAVELLGKRIVDAVARNASIDEIAGLRARQAALLEDACGDRPAAAVVLDELLAAHPAYLPALERLVWHAAHDPDPAAHPAALMRYAAAIGDPETRAHAWIEAARRFADAKERGAAVRAFELAVETFPHDEELRAELEEARAQLMLDRASREIASGDRDGAERRLRELMRVRPYDIDIHVALAELLVAAGRLEEARAHLQDTLASMPNTPPKARLAYAYAGVVAALGDGDEAHRLLHEAHLLDRQALVITLALGQSCFARKLWRETVLMLGPLAEHPDAPRHAARVAEGLVQAGQAEIRALRPARALDHYLAAVRLDPECAPAWHVLAAHEMEKGNTARAIEYFEREAKSAKTAQDRARMLDALGDLALEELGDPARALEYWQRIDEPSADVLRKLLPFQPAGSVERAESCARLAELDPARAKQLTQEAAEGFAACGDFVRARRAAERLVTMYPRDHDAVACASGVVLSACDADTAAAWLTRALRAWEAARDRDPRQATLWRRLGDAERSRQNPVDARAAYDRAIAMAPGSPDALAARRALLELSPKSARTLESLEVLVEADQSPAEVLALARAFVTADRAGDARTMFDLARVLGVALSPADEQFLQATAPRPLACDEAYATTLDEALLRTMAADPDDRPLGDVLDVLAEALPRLASDPTSALRRADLGDASRLSVTGYAAAAALYPQLAKALAGAPTLLFTHPGAPRAQVVLASPPVIVLGPELAEIRGIDLDPVADTKLRFELGRVVELTRPRRLFAVGLDASSFERFVAGIWHAFGGGGDVDPDLARESARIHSAVPVTLRRRVAELVTTLAMPDPHAYRDACERAADRSGLLACGNAGVAIELVAGDTSHVVRAAASRAYRNGRRELIRSRR